MARTRFRVASSRNHEELRRAWTGSASARRRPDPHPSISATSCCSANPACSMRPGSSTAIPTSPPQAWTRSPTFIAGVGRKAARPTPTSTPPTTSDATTTCASAGMDPLLHYVTWGEAEGRRPIAWFDPAWYRAWHAVPPGELCLAHFLRLRRTGLVSPIKEFDAAHYLRTYPDVALAGVDPFEHYLTQGWREDRQPHAGFDGAFYRARYLRNQPDEVPLLHYIRHRGDADLPATRPVEGTTVAREVRRNTERDAFFEEAVPLPPDARPPRPRARLLPPPVPSHPGERPVVGPGLHGVDQRGARPAALRRTLPAAHPARPRALSPRRHRDAPRAGAPGPRRRDRGLRLVFLLLQRPPPARSPPRGHARRSGAWISRSA